MNIIVAETDNPIKRFSDEAKSKFPKTSVLYGNKNNLHEVKRVMGNAPLLSDKWLILLNLRKYPEDVIRGFGNSNHIVVYRVRTRDDLEEVVREFLGLAIPYKVVNNLNSSEEEMIAYICERLKVDAKLAKYIIGRHNGYLPKVMESVEILSILDKVTRDSIKKYTKRSGDLSFNAMFDFIIGMESEKDKYTSVVKLVRTYRYAADFLLKFIIDRFKLYLEVYSDIDKGLLSFENYKDYHEENRTRLKASEYDVRKILQAYTQVSFEKLYLLSCLYEKALKEKATVTRVLMLLQISKV